MPLGHGTSDYAVPHTDLAACPPERAAEARFRRPTLHSQELHVFAFPETGDQPLAGDRSHPADAPGTLLR